MPRASSQFSIPNSQFRNAERGYTLAVLLVILTIMGVILAFSVPRMWSDVLRREREIHTIWVMKQYAQAIDDYRRLNNALPTKLEQLEKKNTPRVLRKTYVNPLSGELDWIMVPEGTATPAMQQAVGVPGGMPSGSPVGVPGGTMPGGTAPSTGTQAPGTDTGGKGKTPRIDPREFSGPFIGVRPPQTGPSMVELFGQSSYETWMYTVNELALEQQLWSLPSQQGGGPKN